MEDSYTAILKDGTKIQIPMWSATVGIQSLSKAGQYIGATNLILISELDLKTVMVAILDSKDPDNTAELIKHFVCSARLDGKKISKNEFDDLFQGNLGKVIEIFAHVVKSQYSSFFLQGLAEEHSQEK